MKLLLGFVIICISLLRFGNCQNSIDVTKFGAIGNGQNDDSQAFLKAWENACGASGSQTVQIPKKKFYLQPLIFKGPCKSKITFQMEGTLLTPKPNEWNSKQKDYWITFKGVEGLIVTGSGKIDGRGESWWQQGKTSTRPRSLSFEGCNNLQIKKISSINTPRNHFSINRCEDATISNVKLIAPETSPNTDGIDIASSSRVNIQDSFIGTGDDCVAINGGSFGIDITNVKCGPGHGISVGSLGKNGEKAIVENVQVKHCTFKGTTNGARIKTWRGGSGYARNIVYEDITLIDTKNPIIINQAYYDVNMVSAVEISDVKFIGFRGTSTGKNAITLNCSNEKACQNIVLDNVNIRPAAKVKPQSVVCNNARGTSQATFPPVPCLSR